MLYLLFFIAIRNLEVYPADDDVCAISNAFHCYARMEGTAASPSPFKWRVYGATESPHHSMDAKRQRSTKISNRRIGALCENKINGRMANGRTVVCCIGICI